MLEYFAYKRYRKHKHEKEAGNSSNDNDVDDSGAGASHDDDVPRAMPVLDREEQSFLENLTRNWDVSDNANNEGGSDDEGARPPLPPRIKTPDLTWDSDSESFVREQLTAADKEAVAAKASEGGHVGRRLSALLAKTKQHAAHLGVPGMADGGAAKTTTAAAVPEQQLALTESEEEREREDLARVLANLDFGSKAADKADEADEEDKHKDDKRKHKAKKHDKTHKGDRGDKGDRAKFAATLSTESAELVRRFVVVLQDLVRGVPTAADDLRSLLDDRDGTLARAFERLPSSLRKLVAQLPSKLTSTLAPELLAAAAESQGVTLAAAADGDGDGATAKSAAKALLLPLVTKPSAIVSMLKAIMNALKLRWPAFIGTSAIWSVALFLLLFVLWYCHKRGREVRLEKEAGEGVAASADAAAVAVVADGTSAVAGPEPSIVVSAAPDGSHGATNDMPRPPIGADRMA